MPVARRPVDTARRRNGASVVALIHLIGRQHHIGKVLGLGVKKAAEKLGGREFATYKITPTGIDICEGSTTDPGIEIGG